MPLPNGGMTFTPFDPLPASELNDMVENIESLADGTGLDNGSVPKTALKSGDGLSYRLGLNTITATATTLLTTSYATYLTVTATATSGSVEISYGTNLQDGASGATRAGTIKIQCDGVDVSGTAIPWQTYVNNLTIHPNMTIAHTPGAGSHTWTLQALSSANGATFIQQSYLKVTQIV